MAPTSKSMNESLANHAKEYSRAQIREGSTQLQNNLYAYKTSDGRRHNHIEDFDPSKHTLKPEPGQNNEAILNVSFNLNTELVEYFKNINDKHCAIFDELADDLEGIANKLSKKYGKDDPKVIAITSKISIIREETTKIKAEVDAFTKQMQAEIKRGQYHSHKSTQQDVQQKMHTMKHKLSNLDSNKQLSSEDKTTLSKYRNEGSFITMVMKFLHIKPSSSRDYKSSIKKADEALSRVNKLRQGPS